MTTFLIVAAILGLLIFIVGAVLFLTNKAPGATLLVVGGVVYAIAEVILLFDLMV